MRIYDLYIRIYYTKYTCIYVYGGSRPLFGYDSFVWAAAGVSLARPFGHPARVQRRVDFHPAVTTPSLFNPLSGCATRCPLHARESGYASPPSGRAPECWWYCGRGFLLLTNSRSDRSRNIKSAAAAKRRGKKFSDGNKRNAIELAF